MATDKGRFDQGERAAELESRARQTRNPELELQRKQERKIKSATKSVAKMREKGVLPPSKTTEPKLTKADVAKSKRLINVAKKYDKPFLTVLKKIPGIKKVAGLAEALIKYSADQPLAKTERNARVVLRLAEKQ